MIIIRKAEDLARALEAPLDPILHHRLEAQREYLADYPIEELALFLIAQPGDTLETITAACSYRLVESARFTIEAEAIDRHGNWLEVLWVLSDDGFGLVLFVPLESDTDPSLLAACQALSPNLNLIPNH